MKEIRSPWFRTSHTSPKLCSQSADNCVPFTCFLLPLAVTQQKILCWESPRKVPNRLTYAKEPLKKTCLTASKRRLGYCKSGWWDTKLIHPFWRDQLTRWFLCDINFRNTSWLSVMYWECRITEMRLRSGASISQATPGTSHTHLNLCPHWHIKFQIETHFMFEATNHACHLQRTPHEPMVG